jgi:hypothetical protein
LRLVVRRATQRKGDKAVARAIATFTELDFDVLIPLTESAAYDLVVVDGERLHRVQCKYTSSGFVDLRNIHSNSQGYVVKFLREDVCDWLYVLHADGREFVVKDCPAGRRGMSVVKMEQIDTSSRLAS